MHFTCRSFIGKPQEGYWSQYWENEPDDPFLISRRGHLFGLISLQADSDSQQASDFGHQIIQKINKSYFSAPDDNLSQQLKNTLSLVTDDLDPQISYPTIIIAVVFKRTLHLAVYHTGHCILRRLNRISPVLTGQDKHITTISGPLQPEDILFFCTDSFFQKFTWSEIKNTLSKNSIQDIEENTLSVLYSFEDQTNLSAALIQSHQQEATPQPEPDEPHLTPDSPPPVPRPSSPPSFLKKLFAKKDIYVSHQQTLQINKRKKINILAALILLFALTISSVLGFRKNQAAKAEAQFQTLTQQIEETLKNARDVKNLNLDSAKELATQADALYQQIQLLNLHPEQIQPYQEQIQSLLAQTGSSQQLDLQSFYDTSLINSQPQYSQMIFSSSNLCLMDSSFGRVDCLSLQRSHKNISISDDIKEALAILESNNNFYILTPRGISHLSKTLTTAKIKFSDLTPAISPIDVQSWNSAVYLLSQNSILKFTPSGSDFSAGSSWLQAGDSALDNPTSLAINGKIWLLGSDGRLQPYIRGQPDSFKPSQQDQITDAKNLVTTMEENFLAFTAGQNLIYVYKKDGQFSAKYNLGDKKIHDIAIDESTNTLYVLCHDQQIYQIAL